MQKKSFLHEKRGVWSIYTTLMISICYTLSLFSYLVYIQCFIKAILLGILPFGAIETGGS